MSSAKFTLHPQLAKDCIHVCDLALCRLLLMNNSHFPWLILVPMRDNLRELHDLSPENYATAMQEIRHVSERFARHTHALKMNVAALGNMVPQLHIHIIARFDHDLAWPGPVWNSGVQTQLYQPEAAQSKLSELQALFA